MEAAAVPVILVAMLLGGLAGLGIEAALFLMAWGVMHMAGWQQTYTQWLTWWEKSRCMGNGGACYLGCLLSDIIFISGGSLMAGYTLGLHGPW